MVAGGMAAFRSAIHLSPPFKFLEPLTSGALRLTKVFGNYAPPRFVPVTASWVIFVSASIANDMNEGKIQ